PQSMPSRQRGPARHASDWRGHPLVNHDIHSSQEQSSMTPDHPFAMLAAVVVASVAVVTDVRSRRIPNWLTASGLLVGLFGNLLLGSFADGASGALSSWLSALAGGLCG